MCSGEEQVEDHDRSATRHEPAILSYQEVDESKNDQETQLILTFNEVEPEKIFDISVHKVTETMNDQIIKVPVVGD